MKNLRQEFADTMTEVGMRDHRLVVLVGDISHGILRGYAEKCAGRYFNVVICEPTIVNMAAGINKTGLIPVVHTIAPFIVERSYEQIKLDFGYQKLFGNFITVGSTFDYAQLGCSHHCYTDVSLMSHIEGTQVMMPGSAEEFKELFLQSYDAEKINYFRLTENPHGQIIPSKVILGKGIRLREGKDISIVCVGPQLSNGVRATEHLLEDGYSVDLIYYHTLKPFDAELLRDSLRKTKKFISIEELSAQDGLYNLCLKSVAGMDRIDSRQLAIDGFVREYGTYEDLCQKTGLTADNLYHNAINMINKKYE